MVAVIENGEKIADKRAPYVQVPVGFDPLVMLPPELWPHADSARWFLATVLRKSMYGKVDDVGFVRLSAKVLSRMMGKRVWPAILKALVQRGCIELSPHVGGRRCRGYRLGESLGDKTRWYCFQEPGLLERLRAHRDSRQRDVDSRLLPVHKKLRSFQRLLSVGPGVDAAIADLSKSWARITQGALIEAIRRGRGGFSVGATGRVFDAITNLSKSLRQYVLLDSEPIFGVDIVGAQPAFLASLFHPDGPKGVPTCFSSPSPSGFVPVCVDCRVGSVLATGAGGRVADFFGRLPDLPDALGADASEFAHLVESGRMYEELLRLYLAAGFSVPVKSRDDEKKSRNWIKKRFLVDVLVCAGEFPSPVAMVFRDRFPSVFRFIAEANVLHHGTVISSLQAMEADFVVRNVASRLVDRIPVVTLHDAVFSRERDRPLVRAAFQQAAEEMGVALKLSEDGVGGR